MVLSRYIFKQALGQAKTPFINFQFSRSNKWKRKSLFTQSTNGMIEFNFKPIIKQQRAHSSCNSSTNLFCTSLLRWSFAGFSLLLFFGCNKWSWTITNLENLEVTKKRKNETNSQWWSRNITSLFFFSFFSSFCPLLSYKRQTLCITNKRRSMESE